MARYTGPKDKLSRREGFDLFSKGEKLKKLNSPPGPSGKKRRATASIYGQQLREKQKVKRLYGLLERQFRNLVRKALNQKGNPEDNLLTMLEQRLDNVLYRAGYFSTRPASRQFVVHGHVQVNDQKINIPSYQVKAGDIVSLNVSSLNNPHIQKQLELNIIPPSWLQKEGPVLKVLSSPNPDQVTEPFNLTTIIEFYSR
jgi:small subunit ribosomal protein S4